jgi:hypothetical protein
LACLVHKDRPYEFMYNAITILDMHNAPLNPQSPYENKTIHNEKSHLSATAAFDLLGVVDHEASKHCLAHKWRASRRLRPEAMAGLVHRSKIAGNNMFHLDETLFNKHNTIDLLHWINEHNKQQASIPHSSVDLNAADTYLLAQVYPEGAPVHPSYPAGHATEAAACATVIKAIFDDTTKIHTLFAPVKPDSDNPASLIALHDEDEESLTVGSELDKLVANIGMGRNWAGIHYRSDHENSILLGEQVAIACLQDYAATFSEESFVGFEFTKFDGTRVKVTTNSVEIVPKK